MAYSASECERSLSAIIHGCAQKAIFDLRATRHIKDCPDVSIGVRSGSIFSFGVLRLADIVTMHYAPSSKSADGKKMSLDCFLKNTVKAHM